MWWSKIDDNRPGWCSSKMSSVWFHGSEKTFWPTTVMNTMSVMLLKQKNIQTSWNSNNSPIMSELGMERERDKETRNELGIEKIKYGEEMDWFQWKPTWKMCSSLVWIPLKFCKLLVAALTFLQENYFYVANATSKSHFSLQTFTSCSFRINMV